MMFTAIGPVHSRQGNICFRVLVVPCSRVRSIWQIGQSGATQEHQQQQPPLIPPNVCSKSTAVGNILEAHIGGGGALMLRRGPLLEAQTSWPASTFKSCEVHELCQTLHPGTKHESRQATRLSPPLPFTHTHTNTVHMCTHHMPCDHATSSGWGAFPAAHSRPRLNL